MSSLLATSLRGTSYLILLQALSKLLTFTLNQLVLRYTTPSVFGFATIQLELLLNTILFLCREGFRLAVQRLPATTTGSQTQKIVNLSYIPVWTGLIVSVLLSWAYMLTAPAESRGIPYFKSTVAMYGLSTVIELLSEPRYNVALHRLLFRVRASCEGFAVMMRCVVTFGVVVSHKNTGALAFACGQLAYSVTLVAAYWFSVSGIFSLRRLDDGKWFEQGLLTLSMTNTLQGLLKHVLTEGDKIMISYFSTNEGQGSYGLAANYGGLLARIVFQPIEEASRSFFSNLLQGKDESQMKEHKSTARIVLCSVIRVYILCSMALVAVGPPVLRRLLPMIVSGTWSAVIPVLAAYSYYIPLLAFNGILEAFVSATATPQVLRRQGLIWIPFSLIFGLSGYLFRHFGAVGLVYANCVNLSLRILWAWSYVRDYFHGVAELSVLPSLVSGAVITVLGTVMQQLPVGGSFSWYIIKVLGVVGMSAVIISISEWHWARTTYSQLKK